MAVTYAYETGTGARHTVTDIKAYEDGTGARHDVTVGYAYNAGLRELVYFRTGVTLNGSSTYWDTVSLTWTAPSFPVSKYVVKRAGTQVYSGTALAFTDTYPGSALMPSTAYAYTIDAYYSDGATETVESSASKSVTTAAHADYGLTATAAAYNQINLAWTDTTQRSIDQYKLARGSTNIYTGTAKSKNDTGLSASTAYSYTLEGFRAGVEIPTQDTASATTPARPTSTGTVYGPGCGSGHGWTQSTAKTLAGPNFSMPRQGYVSSWNLRITGRDSYTGHFNPHFDGNYYGLRNCDSKQPDGTLAWSNINHSGTTVNLSSGNHSCGAKTGGDGAYQTQWGPYNGGDWSTTICMGQVNYWYYTALDDRLIHTDSYCGPDGSIIGERVFDKLTRELISEWGSNEDGVDCPDCP